MTARSDRTPVSDLQDHRDRDLIDAVSAGDRDAFVELYRRYANAALGLSLRILGEQAMAEEVCQEVFLSVWRKAAGYDPARGSVRSWLFAQVHHRAVDAVRREEAERRRSHASLDPPHAEYGVEEIVEAGWLSARRVQVGKALTTLSAEQREVIELAYFDGLTQLQVADRTGVPLGTVKSRTLAAMRRLRQVLSGAAMEDGWITGN
jgi:RNA polymerase sigma-70 factor, ECF subfamily